MLMLDATIAIGRRSDRQSAVHAHSRKTFVGGRANRYDLPMTTMPARRLDQPLSFGTRLTAYGEGCIWCLNVHAPDFGDYRLALSQDAEPGPDPYLGFLFAELRDTEDDPSLRQSITDAGDRDPEALARGLIDVLLLQAEDRPDEAVIERWRERLAELIQDKRKQVRQNGS
ncbi:MAG TPA: hypothetical protein VFI49_13120 [Rudaea sp.]|nr:hypothetical protein [Rudaea sp.]